MNLHEKNPSSPQDMKNLQRGGGQMRLSSRYLADM
jgi:hypothetical protein